MPNSKDVKLSVIIVNYNSERYLKRCIGSIRNKFLGFEIEIIIVNNDVTEDLDGIRKEDGGVKIINTQKNIGFGRAHNIGAAQANGKYLLLINPDTEIVSANIDAVIAEMERDADIGIMGLKILNKDGERQRWTIGFREINLYDLIANNLHFSNKENKKQSVFWVSGAAFMIGKELFGQLNGFDEIFFMYFEDIDLCKRVRSAGKKIVSSDDIVVRHVDGGSRKSETKQKKDYYFSQDHYFKKHFGLLASLMVKVLRKIFA